MSMEEPLSQHPASGAPGAQGAIAREVGIALRNTVKLALSLVCTWSVALLVRFQLPRYLGPMEFGAFNFADSLAGSFFAFLDLGVDIYIQKEVSARPEHASDFVGGLFLLRGVMALVLMSIMFGVLRFTHRPGEVQAAAGLFALGYFLVSLNGTFGALLQASIRVGWLAVSNVVGKVAWGAGLLACIATKRPMAVFAVPMLASEVLRFLLLFPSARAANGLAFRVDVVAVKKAFIASLPYFINGAVLMITGKINISVLEYVVTDTREVGWLGAANNIGSLAMIMSPVLSWIIMPMLARARKRSLDQVYTVVRFALEGLFMVSIPIALLIAVGADVWVRLAFGAKYTQATMSLVAIAPQFVFTYTAMLLSVALVMLDQQWKATRNSLIALVMTPLFIVLIVPFSSRLGQGGGAAGAALAGVFSEVVISSLCLYYVGRRAVGRRTFASAAKSVGVCIGVIVLDRFLRSIGPARIAVDMVAYVIGVLSVGAVRPKEALLVLSWIRHRPA